MSSRIQNEEQTWAAQNKGLACSQDLPPPLAPPAPEGLPHALLLQVIFLDFQGTWEEVVPPTAPKFITHAFQRTVRQSQNP